MTNVATAALFKLHIENMPEALNTKKDIDEYCKQFWKEYKEKAKEAKATNKAAKADKPKRKKGFDSFDQIVQNPKPPYPKCCVSNPKPSNETAREVMPPTHTHTWLGHCFAKTPVFLSMRSETF